MVPVVLERWDHSSKCSHTKAKIVVAGYVCVCVYWSLVPVLSGWCRIISAAGGWAGGRGRWGERAAPVLAQWLSHRWVLAQQHSASCKGIFAQLDWTEHTGASNTDLQSSYTLSVHNAVCASFFFCRPLRARTLPSQIVRAKEGPPATVQRPLHEAAWTPAPRQTPRTCQSWWVGPTWDST